MSGLTDADVEVVWMKKVTEALQLFVEIVNQVIILRMLVVGWMG